MSGTELATRTNGAIAAKSELQPWDKAMREAVLNLLVAESDRARVTEADLHLFGIVCTRAGLDPFLRQAWLIPTKQGMQVRIGIDGHRLIAGRTGELDGVEVAWCGRDGVWRDVWLEDKPPLAAKAIVYRRGKAFPRVVTAREFPARGGNVERQAHHLGLTAERHAYRTAFQAEFAATAEIVRNAGAVLSDGDEEPELPAPAASPAAGPPGAARIVDRQTGEILPDGTPEIIDVTPGEPSASEQARIAAIERYEALYDRLTGRGERITQAREVPAGTAVAQIVRWGDALQKFWDGRYGPNAPAASTPTPSK